MAKERIGLMGGTFNPIHLGHIHMAKAARDEAQLDQVLVIPTGNPPHKQGITPAEDRWKMVCAACAQEEGLTPSRVELDREGVIYTVDTLSILKENYPKADFFYIIGADTLMELKNWRSYEQVLKMCTFLVCPRAWHYTPAELTQERRRLEEMGGRFIMLAMEPMDVSSTELREALQKGEPTPNLPVTVREYCGIRGLYGMPCRLPDAGPWLDKLFQTLTMKRFAHTLAVAHTARHLAQVHHLDVVKAEIGGLLHDCAKCIPLKEMQAVCKLGMLPVDESLMENGGLLHAPAGAALAEIDYCVKDREILNAISCHTTGKPGMTQLDMAVYLADKIEPTRADYPVLSKVRMMAQFSLEKAMLLSMEGTTKYVKKGGKALHPTTMETIRWLQAQPLS